jgi:bifunctional non-homologous end joining protein LigD
MLHVAPPSRSGFIEPCLPSPADKPPSGSNWIHEIKHDGYRLMARRDPVGIRLLSAAATIGQTGSRSWSRR